MYKALKKRNQAFSKLLSETSKQYPSIDSLPDVPLLEERSEKALVDIEKALVDLKHATRGAFSPEEQERMVSQCTKALEKYGLPNDFTNISVLGNPTKQRINSR